KSPSTTSRAASTRERRSTSSSTPTRRIGSSSGAALATSELYRPEHHWGTRRVDVSRRDLPALKARFLLEALPTSGRVIEVGCGGGRLLNTIAAAKPGLELHGCDIRPLPDVPPTFTFAKVDPDDPRLPYDDASADAVVLFDVLEHVLD